MQVLDNNGHQMLKEKTLGKLLLYDLIKSTSEPVKPVEGRN
jgi:hypothetical protein